MYFCLNCTTGQEEKVKALAEKLLNEHFSGRYEFLFPQKEVSEKRGGVRKTVEKPMFPGYLFIYWEDETELTFPFREVRAIPGAVQFLHYDDRTHELRGSDHMYATWLHDHNGIITQSKVSYTEGQKIHVIEGPLVGFDGQIIKVDRHHKRIKVRFEVGGIVSDIDFSVEFISQNAAINSVISQR